MGGVEQMHSPGAVNHMWVLCLLPIFSAACSESTSKNHDLDGTDLSTDISDDAIPDPVDALDYVDVIDEDGGSIHCPAGMAWVPGGDFIMGSDADEGADHERPEHVVFLSAFCMDVHEVTNVDWKLCVEAGACTEPQELTSVTRDDYYTSSDYDDYPVIYVSWYQAVDFCSWMGKTLPTEAQWEKAARGGCELRGTSACEEEDEVVFPWGNGDPDCDLSNHCPLETYPSCCVGDTRRVGYHESGNSIYGVADCAGNVSEWTADWWSEDYYGTGSAGDWEDPLGPSDGVYKVTRSGDFLSLGSDFLRNSNRYWFQPDMSAGQVGFRCVQNL